MFWPDIIQAPYNVFDQRISVSGWLSRLVDKGTEIHARSIFLQGLLIMQSDKRPKYFQRWKKELAEWDELVSAKDISSMEYALSYVIGDKNIDKVIVGVDNRSQLLELISACDIKVKGKLDPILISDVDLIDPSRWNL